VVAGNTPDDRRQKKPDERRQKPENRRQKKLDGPSPPEPQDDRRPDDKPQQAKHLKRSIDSGRINAVV